VLMKDWIRDLMAFVNDQREYKYGTKGIEDFKVATPEGKIEIEEDGRWKELLDLAEIFTRKLNRL
jgi:hypothetical protein